MEAGECYPAAANLAMTTQSRVMMVSYCHQAFENFNSSCALRSEDLTEVILEKLTSNSTRYILMFDRLIYWIKNVATIDPRKVLSAFQACCQRLMDRADNQGYWLEKVSATRS